MPTMQKLEQSRGLIVSDKINNKTEWLVCEHLCEPLALAEFEQYIRAKFCKNYKIG